ncbi:MAG: hypothetical protein KUG82_19170 [Pseudomonadales bacterium]|nr:hypothetical protein [Pseudomonadales bacterium]
MSNNPNLSVDQNTSTPSDAGEALDYNDIMGGGAADAVQYVHKEYHFALDFSEDSIEKIEEFMAHIHRVLVLENEEPIDPKIVVTLSNWFGAYVGEVFRKHHGGNWVIDSRDPEAPAFEVKYEELGLAFPSRIFHRIMGGEENSIDKYYAEITMKISKLRNVQTLELN